MYMAIVEVDTRACCVSFHVATRARMHTSAGCPRARRRCRRRQSAVLPSPPRSHRPAKSVPSVTSRLQPPGRPPSRARSQRQRTSKSWHPPNGPNDRSESGSFWMPSSAQVTVSNSAQPGHMIDSKRLIGAKCTKYGCIIVIRYMYMYGYLLYSYVLE